MTRIIAGFAGSLALAVPKSGTRPTSDRVREAIFSALEAADAIDGANVLDLFAGSGALGLEAASRGAAEVQLVERDQKAAGIAGRNARLVAAAAAGSAPRIHVAAAPVASWLGGAVAVPHWDLAFLDPPYDLGDAALTAVLAALVPTLREGATVVVERSNRSPAPEVPVGLEHVRSRSYGETAVHWLERADAN